MDLGELMTQDIPIILKFLDFIKSINQFQSFIINKFKQHVAMTLERVAETYQALIFQIINVIEQFRVKQIALIKFNSSCPSILLDTVWVAPFCGPPNENSILAIVHKFIHKVEF